MQTLLEESCNLGVGGPSSWPPPGLLLPSLPPPLLLLPFSWVLSSSRALIALLMPKNTSVPNNEEHRTKGTEIT